MIAITGLMRSGTSPLAMILHQAGVTMGAFMRFPTSNRSAHLEWEDAELADALCMEIMDPTDPPGTHSIIDNYVRMRKRRSFGKPWGVKTPFLLPFVSDLREICAEIEEPLTLIVTDRDYKDTVTSMRRQASHLSVFERGAVWPRAMRIQKHLASHWAKSSEGAEIFDFKKTQEYPREVAKRLAALAGVSADFDVATRGIRGREL